MGEEKEFGFALQRWPCITFGFELGQWYIKIFLGFHSIIVGWIEWDYEIGLEEEEED